MSNIISVTDFRNHVSDVVNRVHYKNETIFLMRGATVVAKISGVAPTYPYARQIKAARTRAQSFVGAITSDLVKIAGRVGQVVTIFVRNLAEKVGKLILAGVNLLKHWVAICFAVDREIWFGQAVKRRKCRI